MFVEKGHAGIDCIFHLIATLTYFLLIYLNTRDVLYGQRYTRIKDLEAWRSVVKI